MNGRKRTWDDQNGDRQQKAFYGVDRFFSAEEVWKKEQGSTHNNFQHKVLFDLRIAIVECDLATTKSIVADILDNYHFLLGIYPNINPFFRILVRS